MGADETLDCDGDGAIDVLGRAIFGKAHFAEGFADAHYGFEVADLGLNGFSLFYLFIPWEGELGFWSSIYRDGDCINEKLDLR